MLFTQMTAPPSRGSRPLDYLPHVIVMAVCHTQPDIEYWRSWSQTATEAGKFLASVASIHLQSGVSAIQKMQWATHKDRVMGEDVDRPYRRLLGAMALTELLRSTTIGDDLCRAATDSSPKAILHVDGGDATWAIHARPAYIPAILKDYRHCAGLQWWRNDTLYVQTRYPAHTSKHFDTGPCGEDKSTAFNANGYVSLRPHLDIEHIADRFALLVSELPLITPNWAGSPN